MKLNLKPITKPFVKAFTLLEMLLVLLIISVLMLLFIPNLSKQKDKVRDAGNEAVVKVVENQAELFELNQNSKATLGQLIQEGQHNANQVKAYKEYYGKHKNEAPKIPD